MVDGLLVTLSIAVLATVGGLVRSLRSCCPRPCGEQAVTNKAGLQRHQDRCWPSCGRCLRLFGPGLSRRHRPRLPKSAVDRHDVPHGLVPDEGVLRGIRGGRIHGPYWRPVRATGRVVAGSSCCARRVPRQAQRDSARGPSSGSRSDFVGASRCRRHRGLGRHRLPAVHDRQLHVRLARGGLIIYMCLAVSITLEVIATHLRKKFMVHRQVLRIIHRLRTPRRRKDAGMSEENRATRWKTGSAAASSNLNVAARAIAAATPKRERLLRP